MEQSNTVPEPCDREYEFLFLVRDLAILLDEVLFSCYGRHSPYLMEAISLAD